MHGSNRLGGNSLSDLLVFGKRAGDGEQRRDVDRLQHGPVHGVPSECEEIDRRAVQASAMP
jgi:succinate dehydrogenase/fumarate reductase flavoprotein subunit